MKSKKNFFHRVIGYNRMYRLFLLLVSLIWFDWFTALIVYWPILFILDTPFRNDVLAIRRRYYQKQAQKERRLEIIREKEARIQSMRDNIRWYRVKLMIKRIGYLIQSIIVPYLTRLPVFELYWQDTLFHYRYRHLLKFVEALEKTNGKSIKVTNADIDQYHHTFFIRLNKITPANARVKIENFVSKYFGSTPDGVVVQLKRTTGQVLIPRELITEE